MGKAFFRYMLLAAVMSISVLAGVSCVFAGDEDSVYRISWNEKTGGGSGAAVNFVPRQDLAVSSPAEYTVMVYIIGSNLESAAGKATKDIEEMMGAQLDFSRTNLLLCTGGSYAWKRNISARNTSVLDLSRPDSDWTVASNAGNADMGRAETLSAFVNFGTTYYPAAHYGLIFWDHGGGPLWGYGLDELFGEDSLLLSEMQDAMDETIFGGDDTKLDWVGFDACLMGSVECMHVWSAYADYMVSSEELEPGDGWNYGFLSQLNHTSDPVDLTGVIVESYGAEGYTADSTLSCVDLAEMEEGLPALYALLDALEEDISNGAFEEVVRHVADTRSFGRVTDGKGGASRYYDLVDLRDLGDQLAELYPEEAAAVQALVERAVVHNCASIGGANGISMYYPLENKTQLREMGEEFSHLGMGAEYAGLLDAIGSAWLYSPGRDWDLGEIERTAEGGILRLTQEEMASMKEVYYTVYKVHSDEDGTRYSPCMEHVRLSPDDSGVVHIPADPLLAAVGNGVDVSVVSAVQVEDGGFQDTYQTVNTRLLRNEFSAYEFTWYQDSSSIQPADFTFTHSEEGEVRVKSLTQADGNFGKTRANELHLGDWEAVMDPTRHTYYPLRDQNGRMLPGDQWYECGVVYRNIITLEESFGFHMIPASRCGGTYCLQVVLEDLMGDTYATSLMDLGTEDPSVTTVSVRLGLGTITYLLEDERAAVLSYEGKDTQLAISEEVRGKPVTSISAGAFQENYYLQSIQLPPSLEAIEAFAFCNCTALGEIDIPEGTKTVGRGAFAYCTALKRVSLPGTLQSVGEAVFAGDTALEEVEGAASCDGYSLRDGCLYSADGEVLLACPGARKGSLVIPEGTRAIAHGAFWGGAMESVVFPDSLEEIDNHAFYNCMNLAVPEFPEGLRRILDSAFGMTADRLSPRDPPEEPVRIVLPSTLEEIGKNAFGGFVYREFTVAEENPYYRSLEGHLTNKAGDAIVSPAIRSAYVLVIPEGIVRLDRGLIQTVFDPMFYFMDNRVDVYVPDSVRYIPEDLHTSKEIDPVFHASPLSAAWAYASQAGFEQSSDTDPPTGEAELAMGGSVLTFTLHGAYAVWTGCRGEEVLLEIPPEVEGRPVKRVGDGRPVEETDPVLQFVILPDTVEEIESEAFTNSSCLLGVMGGTIRRIGEKAFGSTIEPMLDMQEVEKTLESVSARGIVDPTEEVFYVGSALTYVAPGAFDIFNELRAFAMDGENGHFSVVDGLLYSADGKELIACPAKYGERVVIPEGTTVIGSRAFYQNWMIEEVVIPDSVISIEENAFKHCWFLKSVVCGEGLQNIGRSAFSWTGISELHLPEGLQFIEEDAFAHTAISELQLPESLQSIGAGAFSSCTQLTSVTFGPALREVDWGTFSNMAVHIDIDPRNPYYRTVDGMITDATGHVLLYCPESSGEGGILHLPEGITVLDSGALSGDKWTDVWIPDSVEYISSAYSLLGVRVHASKSSYAASFCLSQRIRCVYERKR